MTDVKILLDKLLNTPVQLTKEGLKSMFLTKYNKPLYIHEINDMGELSLSSQSHEQYNSREDDFEDDPENMAWIDPNHVKFIEK